MMASRSQTLLRKPGSACAARSSGWRGSVKAVLPHWRSDGVFAAPSSRSVDPQQLQQTVDLRHQRCTLRRIAKALQAPLATVGRVMNALGLGQLRNLEPKKPVRRYPWERPGDLAQFHWINTLLGNLKTSLSGTFQGFDSDKYARRDLRGYGFRFNRRFSVQAMVKRIAHAVCCCMPCTERSPRVAAAFGSSRSSKQEYKVLRMRSITVLL